jgi:PPM family protein phosphatase
MAHGSESIPALRFVGAMLSDVGRVRAVNEDAVLYIAASNSTNGRGGLAVVADGMGGHAAGEVASAMATEIVSRVYFERDEPVPEALAAAFSEANLGILKHAESDSAYNGMGTTCTALALEGSQVWLAHVGDSRAYLLRNGVLDQLSKDQTLVAQMVERGELSEEEAESSPVSNVILQALGTRPDIDPEIWNKPLPVQAGDVLILCSDGLSKMVPNQDIAGIAGRLAPHEACQALMEAALNAGGHDNISLGIFAVAAGERPAVQDHNTTRPIKIGAQSGPPHGSNGTGAATTRRIVPKI